MKKEELLLKKTKITFLMLKTILGRNKIFSKFYNFFNFQYFSP